MKAAAREGPFRPGRDARGPVRCLELSIFYRCVNRCLFCSSARRMEQCAERPLSLAEIEAVLRGRRAAGYTHVCLSGGEPTLHPDFPKILRLAKGLGYRTQAVSNGAALSLDRFASAVLPHLDELCLSLHGSRAEVHDALTGRAGSFERLRAALARAGAWRGELFLVVNTVVTKLNAHDLEATARLAAGCGRLSQYWLSSLIPEGEALARFDELALPFYRALESVPAAAAAAEAAGARLMLFGFPPCVLGPHRGLAAEPLRHPGAAVGRRREAGSCGLEEREGGLEAPARSRTPRCAGCAAAGCAGLWDAYRARFGDAELEALA